MKTRQAFGWRRLLLGGALLAAATLAQAQFVWIDDKGLRQYSDRPPPPSVPLARILKGPGLAAQKAAAAASATASAAAAPASAPAAKAEPTMAQRNADFRKRQADAAMEEQKAADASKRQSDIDNHCKELRQSKKVLESGRRIGTTDKAGEPSYMDDAERAAQLQKAQRALADCK